MVLADDKRARAHNQIQAGQLTTSCAHGDSILVVIRAVKLFPLVLLTFLTQAEVTAVGNARARQMVMGSSWFSYQIHLISAGVGRTELQPTDVGMTLCSMRGI
jgi:hypothetical protein